MKELTIFRVYFFCKCCVEHIIVKFVMWNMNVFSPCILLIEVSSIWTCKYIAFSLIGVGYTNFSTLNFNDFFSIKRFVSYTTISIGVTYIPCSLHQCVCNFFIWSITLLVSSQFIFLLSLMHTSECL